MTNRKRAIAATAVIVLSLFVGVFGPGFSTADGQILSEVTYYEENFTRMNGSAATLASDLQNQHLNNPGQWRTFNSYERQRGWDNDYSPRYGDASRHIRVGVDDTSKPWLSSTIRKRYDDEWQRHAMQRQVNYPDSMDNPVLIVEHGEYQDDNRYMRTELAANGHVVTTRNWNQNPGSEIGDTGARWNRNNVNKIGNLIKRQHRGWTTSMIPLDGSQNTTTVTYGGLASNNNNNRWWAQWDIRQLYIVEGSSQTFQTEVAGYASQPADDSYNGPSANPLILVNKPTAEGEDTVLRSQGSQIRREFNLTGVSEKPEKVYFELDGTALTDAPVNWEIRQYGQTVASGSIDGRSSAVSTSEINLRDDQFTVVINSNGAYDVSEVNVVALQETTEGDPLASQKPINLDPQTGYDRTIGVLISLLDISTTTLTYLVLVAITIGGIAFSYTRSVRGQEFGQSMIAGAIIAGVVIVGLVPTFNLATWIFTGDTQRAPLANPALEAEPPTYFSTEFQDGTMHGFTNPRGSARPVSVGETFNLQMRGDNAMVRKNVHISLGDSLDTGFVRLNALAKSTAGYNNPHVTNLRVRVYVTDGSEPNRINPGNDVTGNDPSNHEDLVAAEQWARSFDGETVPNEGTITFPLDGNTIYVEVIAGDNRNDELAQAAIREIAVGATTEGNVEGET